MTSIKSSQKAASPSKSPRLMVNLDSVDFCTDYVIMDKDLLRGLSEKEVEIEHLKTTIIALN